ncbi:hypothetical protein [Priestia koreensis]|uniref:hypothetical protein n=1 Tax=Priestia koreensis TaxID=284581 RepID=UPI00203EC8EA|nr:hypothetical protein [Priestia koreensis]MCM3005551.1 hypothetical protein [Priestia koreensis]
MPVKNNRLSIPYPSDEEIEKQVNLIVAKGLPKRPSFFTSLYELMRQVGWRAIFINRVEGLLIGILTLIVWAYFYLGNYTSSSDTSHFYVLLFVLSPLIFISLMLCSYYYKKLAQTFELEMTTKYTIFQLLAVKMLVFSSVAIIVNMTCVFLLSLAFNVDVLRGILLSMTGLFSFSAGLLLFLMSGNFLRRVFVFMGVWGLVNGTSFIIWGEQYQFILKELPSFVYGIILAVSFCVYMISLKHVFNRKQEEGLSC